MGNSTITLSSVFDEVAAKGIPDPRQGASGYGDILTLQLANEVIADIVCERYNQKWNSANATPFCTNSWQQDYPQLLQPAGLIGWGETCPMESINNTGMPKPYWNLTWRRALPQTNLSVWRPENICWMYNNQMRIGVWPGANITIYPLVSQTAYPQNPLLSMRDKNGNILIVTTPNLLPTAVPCHTGSVAPFAAANAVEGTTVNDGTVVWTVVSPTGQGFRIDVLPSATPVTYQISPVYQIEPPRFLTLSQKLDPIPDSFSRYFYRGLASACLMASVNPGDFKRGQDARGEWLNALNEAKKQGDRETNIYGILPATQVVKPRWSESRPRTTGDPN